MSRRRPPAVYAWQRNPVFKFFSSVNLAMILLSVLIIGSTIGTLYESSFDAKVARHYVYEAPWFNLWLLLLALNLACAAFSRMPWKRHHTGFLITHLGIIVLLAGSWIGSKWGVEGTMRIFKNEPASNLLLIDQRVLQIRSGPQLSQAIPVELMNRKPSPEKPWPLAITPDGWRFELLEHAQALDVDLTPKAVNTGGVPAIQINVSTATMGQKLDAWLLADHPQSSTFDMGLASVVFRKGRASAQPAGVEKPDTENGAVEIEEMIFAFANMPEQVGKAIKGGPSGAKLKLRDVTADDKGTLVVEFNGRTTELRVADVMNESTPVEGTPFSAKIENYWPDFRIREGGPESASDQPNNPAVLVRLAGRAVPVSENSAHGAELDQAAVNRLTIFVDDSGALTYELSSRKSGASSGALSLNTPLPTGWADWQLVVTELIPQAEEHFTAKPAQSAAAPAPPAQPKPEGIRVRATREQRSVDQWVPFGWQITLSAQPSMLVAYGYRQKPLPISIELLDFEVERNEGTDTPAGFKSTIRIADMHGDTATGQCWMNNPVSYPDHWLNTWSGLTYKISQASWNPENLDESTVQILRDPGWGLKWIGSLLVVSGVFTMFYLRPYPSDIAAAAEAKSKLKAAPAQKKRKEPVAV